MKKIKDCIIFGTRPEAIKFSILAKSLKPAPFIINTGQQRELTNMFLDEFDVKPNIDLKLMKHDQSLSGFLGRCIQKLGPLIRQLDPERIWVEGDTSSALAGALVGFIEKRKVIHVEAGLRTYDKCQPFPEETNRVCIDQIADILFAPTIRNKNQLLKEGVRSPIWVTGNVNIDVVEQTKPTLPNISPLKEDFILVTMHRREAFGKPMKEMLETLKKLSSTIKIVFPVHLNPNVRKAVQAAGIETVEPMNYKTLLTYLKFCKFVITDSGGIQEEAPSFGKPVLVLRNTTERQELIVAGFGKLVGWEPNQILSSAMALLQDVELYNSMCATYNPFGDGTSAQQMIKILNMRIS